MSTLRIWQRAKRPLKKLVIRSEENLTWTLLIGQRDVGIPDILVACILTTTHMENGVLIRVKYAKVSKKV